MMIDFRNYTSNWSVECSKTRIFISTGFIFKKWYMLKNVSKDSLENKLYTWITVNKHDWSKEIRNSTSFTPNFDKTGSHTGLPDEVLKQINKII